MVTFIEEGESTDITKKKFNNPKTSLRNIAKKTSEYMKINQPERTITIISLCCKEYTSTHMPFTSPVKIQEFVSSMHGHLECLPIKTQTLVKDTVKSLLHNLDRMRLVQQYSNLETIIRAPEVIELGTSLKEILEILFGIPDWTKPVLTDGEWANLMASFDRYYSNGKPIWQRITIPRGDKHIVNINRHSMNGGGKKYVNNLNYYLNLIDEGSTLDDVIKRFKLDYGI